MLRPKSIDLGSLKARLGPEKLGQWTTFRRADGTAGPSPASRVLQKTNEGIQELYVQAKKTAHVKTKAEKRRDSLRRQIRVITEAGEYRPSTPRLV
ncbi:hypothetical protein NKR23_g76 [Pleurostoma richardsiae]|uniref:Uncharacterized protein n=1 Tax=Pleurostoma richardsiae TaxID=41990 RepID=A0AA38S7S6_9PEZI|nr:hypothetical protein NKR23_g76 [Pleurostoma richardsiae]